MVMNGAEKAILNELKWIKEKQISHDKLLGKVFDKFESGSGKISANREAVAVNTETIDTHKKLFYALFTVVSTLAVALIVNALN